MDRSLFWPACSGVTIIVTNHYDGEKIERSLLCAANDVFWSCSKVLFETPRSPLLTQVNAARRGLRTWARCKALQEICNGTADSAGGLGID